MKTLSLFSAFLLTWILTGCGSESVRHTATEGGDDPIGVETLQIRLEPSYTFVPEAGTIRSAQTATLAARIQGVVTRIAVAPGQAVKANDPLARLDSEEWEARLQKAVAEQDAARIEFDRLDRLSRTRAATSQEVDAARARLDAARAGFRESEIMLGYTVLRAPFDGIITRKFVDHGDLLTPGTPAFEIVDPNRYRAEVYLAETRAAGLSIGDVFPFEVSAISLTGEAAVSEITPAVDSLSRRALVKLNLPESAKLRNGQFVRVHLRGPEKTRLTVPQGALTRRGQLEYVFVVENQRARMRIVRTGNEFGDKIEIVAGLSEGEHVVTGSEKPLRDGSHVETW